MRRLAALILGVLVCGCLSAAAAQQSRDILGTWQAVEIDSVFAKDTMFGQYRYDMVIEHGPSGLRAVVSLTGTTYSDAKLDGDRLTAAGQDPTRGPTRLDIRFGEYTFEGTVTFGSQSKKITGQLAPAERAERERVRLEAVRRETQTTAEELRSVTEVNAGLTDRLAQTERALAAAEQRVAVLQSELLAAEALATRALAEKSRAPPAPAAAPRKPLAIRVIDPPPSDADVIRLTDHGLPSIRITGRISGGAPLLSLRANGRPVEQLDNGLFQTDIPAANAPATLEIVAIDRDGNRTSRSLVLRPPSPLATGAAGKPAATLSATCYQLGLVAMPPDPAGLDACRAALEAEPDNALNHYHLGAALSRLGRHQEAVSAYREAAAIWARR